MKYKELENRAIEEYIKKEEEKQIEKILQKN